jgi:hypothetical protein
VNVDFALRFAEEWAAAWNAHDLDRILTHYADDVVCSSPHIVRRLAESSGEVHGIDKSGRIGEVAWKLSPTFTSRWRTFATPSTPSSSTIAISAATRSRKCCASAMGSSAGGAAPTRRADAVDDSPDALRRHYVSIFTSDSTPTKPASGVIPELPRRLTESGVGVLASPRPGVRVGVRRKTREFRLLT